MTSNRRYNRVEAPGGLREEVPTLATDFDPYLVWLGIPITARPPNFYQLLHLDPSITDPSVVRSLALQRIAYVRNFQKGEHADACARLLEELAFAEKTLTNPAERKAYDKQQAATAKAKERAAIDAANAKAKERAAVEAAKVKASRRSDEESIERASANRRPRKRRKSRELKEAVRWIGGSIAVFLGIFAFYWAGQSLFRGTLTGGGANHVATFRAIPEDAQLVVLSNNGRVEKQESLIALSCDSNALKTGVRIAVSRSGFITKSMQIAASEFDADSPIEVKLDPAPKPTAIVNVSPANASVVVEQGEAQPQGDGRWLISAPLETSSATVVVEADGYTKKSLVVSLDGSAKTIALGVALADAMKYYGSPENDSALQLIGRAGMFNGSVGRLALSRNGKFLAVVERCVDPTVQVWDVSARRFVGPVVDFTERGILGVPPTSIAVANDGRFVAVAMGCLCVFDMTNGKEIHRVGSDAAKLSAFEAVSFSGDDARLFATLADGRIEIRDVGEWESTEVIRGFEPRARGVRFSADGAVATAQSDRGIVRWSQDKKAVTVLEPAATPPIERPWSAPPALKYCMAAQSNNAWGARNCEDGAAVSTVTESSTVTAIEAIDDDHAIVVVLRSAPSSSSRALADGLSSIRLANAAGASVCEVLIPTMVYGAVASDDGKVLATITERERAVHLWKVDTKGKPCNRFSTSTQWERPSLTRWEGAGWWKPGRSAVLTELSDGVWKISIDGDEMQLREKSRHPAYIELAFRKGELLLYNSGHCWLRNDEAKRYRWAQPTPNGDAMPDDSEGSDRYLPYLRGPWSSSDLPVRKRNQVD